MKNLAMVLTIILAIMFSTGSAGAQAPLARVVEALRSICAAFRPNIRVVGVP